jgi:hypothetical protein
MRGYDDRIYAEDYQRDDDWKRFLGNLTGPDHLYGFILPEQAHSSEKTEHKTYLEEGRTLG